MSVVRQRGQCTDLGLAWHLLMAAVVLYSGPLNYEPGPAAMLLKVWLLKICQCLLLVSVSALCQAASLNVDSAWARVSPPGAQVGVAYMTLFNPGTAPVVIASIATPVAANAQVHVTINDNGMMKMRQVTPLVVAAGELLSLEPGGKHMMLMGLREGLVAGTDVEINLILESGEIVSIAVPVSQVNPAEQ
jgi:copper(I)-binding protein